MKLKKELDSAPEHISLPSSSEDEDESQSDLSEEEHEINDPFLSEGDSDSDDAPEILSFKSANENLKLLKKQTTDVIKTHAEEKRRKRKELHEELLRQKEEKKRKIEEKMLPDDVLENLNDEPDHQANQSDENSNEIKDDKDILEDDSIEEIIEEHGSSVFKCKVLTDKAKHSRSAPESFEAWKSKFGVGSRVRRENNTKAAVLKKEKQLISRH